MKYPKPKKPTRTKQKKEADKLFSIIIRSKGVCELAGKDKVRCNGAVQCCHIIGRANMRLRWQWYNALCCCQSHHVFYTYHPFEWFEIVAREFPDHYKYVTEHRNELNTETYEEIINRLKVT